MRRVKGRMLADRPWPPPDGREPITTHREGGFIATGACGRPHLVGGGWSYWSCPSCARHEAKQRVTDRQARMLELFYPTREVPVTNLHVLPVELVEANAFIAAHHRHHHPVIGHRFSIGCVDRSGVLRGVCVVGRPVARLAGLPRDVAEVTRLATDGTPNACSILYGAAARAARAMGFLRIQTFTLTSEGGASLRAAGWAHDGAAGGGRWVHTDGRPRRTDQPTELKNRWSVTFRPRPDLVVDSVPQTDMQEVLL